MLILNILIILSIYKNDNFFQSTDGFLSTIVEYGENGKLQNHDLQ